MSADSTGRARHLARRSRVRSGIPGTVGLPKFLNPSEIGEVYRLHEEDPTRSWDSILQEIIELSLSNGNPPKPRNTP